MRDALAIEIGAMLSVAKHVVDARAAKSKQEKERAAEATLDAREQRRRKMLREMTPLPGQRSLFTE